LAAVVAVVELGAVFGTHADVVHLERVALLGGLARAFLEVGDDELGRHLLGKADLGLAGVDRRRRRLALGRLCGRGVEHGRTIVGAAAGGEHDEGRGEQGSQAARTETHGTGGYRRNSGDEGRPTDVTARRWSPGVRSPQAQWLPSPAPRW